MDPQLDQAIAATIDGIKVAQTQTKMQPQQRLALPLRAAGIERGVMATAR